MKDLYMGASEAGAIKTVTGASEAGASEAGAIKTGAIKTGAGPAISLAERDKMILHLQKLRECQKNQLKKDYERLKKNVSENPYLQSVIEEYESYFLVEKQQIQALKTLLEQVESIEDKAHIKKTIAALEKKKN